MAGFEFLVAVITVLAAVLLFISILAYNRARSWRLLFVSVVFLLFLLKGIVMSLSIFTSTLKDVENELVLHLFFDVIILLFLFISVLSPPKKGEKAIPDARKSGKVKN